MLTTTQPCLGASFQDPNLLAPEIETTAHIGPYFNIILIDIDYLNCPDPRCQVKAPGEEAKMVIFGDIR